MALFHQHLDKFGRAFISATVDDESHFLNVSNRPDITSFISDNYAVKKFVSGPFQRDLTENREDILIAFLSLLLLFLVEATVSAFLLRTENGKINVFGFSVKYIIEVIQDFDAPCLLRRKKSAPWSATLKPRLVIFAFTILSLLFVMEVAIIFLTNQRLKPVSNDRVSFRIIQPLLLNQPHLYFHVRTSVDRPCMSTLLVGALQGSTRISACVSMQTAEKARREFINREYNESISVEIATDIHDYGAEHQVKIGTLKASYSARAYFTLHDGRTRMMKSEPQSKHEKKRVTAAHKQYIAALFTSVMRAKKVKNGTEDLDKSNKLSFVSNEIEGHEIEVLGSGKHSHKVKSRRYISNVAGEMPGGYFALRVAQHAFRASSGMTLSGGGTEDLFLTGEVQYQKSVVWSEQVRLLNWLSLLMICTTCLALQVPLHCFLKPISTAYIAGLWVEHSFGRQKDRSPMELGRDERKKFQVCLKEKNNDYLYGAETKGKQIDLSEYY